MSLPFPFPLEPPPDCLLNRLAQKGQTQNCELTLWRSGCQVCNSTTFAEYKNHEKVGLVVVWSSELSDQNTDSGSNLIQQLPAQFYLLSPSLPQNFRLIAGKHYMHSLDWWLHGTARDCYIIQGRLTCCNFQFSIPVYAEILRLENLFSPNFAYPEPNWTTIPQNLFHLRAQADQIIQVSFDRIMFQRVKIPYLSPDPSIARAPISHDGHSCSSPLSALLSLPLLITNCNTLGI